MHQDSAESTVDLVVPVKSLDEGKSRLYRSLGHDDLDRHRALVLAIVTDTIDAALRAARVRRAVVVTPDPEVLATVAALGAIGLRDTQEGDLNASLSFGHFFLRGADAHANVGVLLADLPALRPDELDACVDAARGRRAMCTDRHGTGTALLLTGAGQQLQPRFGAGSASAHRATGAVPLDGSWPRLRCDVDTAADLLEATALGLGARTHALVSAWDGRPAQPMAVTGSSPGLR
ncbi:2-phospho-L-lactate guanylyltransferase [Amycolatopsis marina]|uniref:Phosphoenolpyruvate guanylyltransferase n=1 Tax=Amycolatopsis marina TaxID=490629 RepID=A0A1I1ATS0_9PSEU|nr:2-phospho-L-lactate guanylyltransferase [Amycolatopsis marina]SFB40816.1 2-phospho-L-lactate guanylyltransferase [Amycolatopsis marina]